MSTTFNVSNLSLFDAASDSRTNLFEEGEDDVSMDMGRVGGENISMPSGPITKERAKIL